jgi:LacI family transcriptional regulator
VMAELGLEAGPRLIVPARSYAESEGARCCRALLEDGADFTAVFAGNDLMAIGCIDALREAGLDCPRDVSVVGMNDMAWTDRFSPPLTTVRLPHYALGTAAAELLLERLEAADGGLDRRIVLPTELVVRGSTAPPRDGARPSA